MDRRFRHLVANLTNNDTYAGIMAEGLLTYIEEDELTRIPEQWDVQGKKGFDYQEQQLSEELWVYPNPATNMITIESPVKSVYVIYNSLNQAMEHGILREGGSGIDVSAYPAGLYLIKIEGAPKVYKINLIK